MKVRSYVFKNLIGRVAGRACRRDSDAQEFLPQCQIVITQREVPNVPNQPEDIV